MALVSYLILVFLIIIVSVALLGVFSLWFWEWLYFEPTSESRTYYAKTNDGHVIALHRYCPAKESDQPAVLLIHGLSSNRYAFDLPHSPKLSLFLRDSGMDVWVPELRGSGKSKPPKGESGKIHSSWGFEDHLFQDIPTILEFVKGNSKASDVHIIGHSMGGMLTLAYAGLHPELTFASITTLGSSVFMENKHNTMVLGLMKMKGLIKLVPIWPFSAVAKILIPVAHSIPGLLMGFFEPQNIKPHTLRRILALGEESVSPTKIWKELAEFREKGSIGSGPVEEIIDGLSRNNSPICLIAGSNDRVISACSIKRTYEAISNGGKNRFVELGKNTNCLNDYGHMDLRVGVAVESEVFPIILEWLLLNNKPAACLERSTVFEEQTDESLNDSPMGLRN